MSDSEASNAPISDALLEETLRNIVEKTYKSDPDQLTIKRLRGRVEQDLGLDDGFFKTHATWNAAQEAQSQPLSSQLAPNSNPARGKVGRDAKATDSRKRLSMSNEGSKKRRKNNDSREDTPSGDREASEEAEFVKAGHRQSTSSSALSELDEKHEETVTDRERGEVALVTAEQGSESELSVLIDEDPKPKKRARKASSEKPRSKKKEGSQSSKAPQQPTDPDSEEIRRLQGWLVKCGIRKMWFKELAPYDTPKAKIRHLKDMLTEAGMTGRYSQEKATQIREERELRADLEDVQAGNKQWGRAESDGDENGRPRRRVARGLQELDFLKDDDDEESD
ncbi:MAG: hypothetical protein Q9225_000788 [Loekoesia sp. 1 TL-2023]